MGQGRVFLLSCVLRVHTVYPITVGYILSYFTCLTNRCASLIYFKLVCLREILDHITFFFLYVSLHPKNRSRYAFGHFPMQAGWLAGNLRQENEIADRQDLLGFPFAFLFQASTFTAHTHLTLQFMFFCLLGPV